MDDPELRRVLADFCGAPLWVEHMMAARPFATPAAVLQASEAAAEGATADDWREAFRHHPRIGERAAERTQSDTAQDLSAREQSSMQAATPSERAALAESSRAYEDRFGHVFIVSAAGKTPAEMIAALRERLNNDPATELRVAAAEHRRITRLRLERLLG